MDFNPVGIKYLGGWGDAEGSGLNPLAGAKAGAAGSLDEIMKTIRKYSLKDRKYIRDKWRKHYLFYVESLLDQEDQVQVMNDGYLKKLDKNLGL